MAKCSRPSARSRHSRPARRCNDRAQMIGRYGWAGGTEERLRFGPDTGPVVVLALPLFEEANRTRAFAVTMLRALAERGVASVLPDLPGQGESLVPLHDMTILRMQEAYEGVIDHFDRQGRACYGAGIRRSEEHTSELQSLMRTSYAVFCLKKKNL